MVDHGVHPSEEQGLEGREVNEEQRVEEDSALFEKQGFKPSPESHARRYFSPGLL
jgi:hypothetical protein